MRPRVFPAEDVVLRVLRDLEVAGFNEAAGIPRGRLVVVGFGVLYFLGFNEAAGIPRGRPAYTIWASL